MTPFSYILLAGAIVLLYVVLVHRLQRILQPYRLVLATLGEEVLSDPRLPESKASLIRFQLDHAYSAGIAWQLAVMFPIMAISTAISDRRSKPAAEPCPDDLRQRVDEISVRATISVLANSPLASLLILIEGVIFAVLMLPLGRALRAAFRDLDPRDHNGDHNGGRVSHA